MAKRLLPFSVATSSEPRGTLLDLRPATRDRFPEDGLLWEYKYVGQHGIIVGGACRASSPDAAYYMARAAIERER